MSNNAIGGPLPACISAAPALQELYLSRNALRGPLPDNWNDSSVVSMQLADQSGEGIGGGWPLGAPAAAPAPRDLFGGNGAAALPQAGCSEALQA
jgi:hypothetical protein